MTEMAGIWFTFGAAVGAALGYFSAGVWPIIKASSDEADAVLRIMKHTADQLGQVNLELDGLLRELDQPQVPTRNLLPGVPASKYPRCQRLVDELFGDREKPMTLEEDDAKKLLIAAGLDPKQFKFSDGQPIIPIIQAIELELSYQEGQ